MFYCAFLSNVIDFLSSSGADDSNKQCVFCILQFIYDAEFSGFKLDVKKNCKTFVTGVSEWFFITIFIISDNKRQDYNGSWTWQH